MLTKLQVVYDVTDDAIALKRGKYALLKADTPQGYEQVRLAIADLRDTRVAIEKRRKELKADSLEYGRRVDTVAKLLIEQLLEIEQPLKDQKAAVDEEKARVKAKKEAVERKAAESQMRAALDAEAARLATERAALQAERAKLEQEKAAAQPQQQPRQTEAVPVAVPDHADTMVTIPQARYKELLRAEAKLDALEQAGVDNWEGYSHAMEILNKGSK